MSIENPSLNPWNDPGKPIYMFFYGSLMDPDVLQIIANLEDSPKLFPASITGFKMKMWIGTYPTIMPATEAASIIQGVCWETTDKKHIELLQNYETSAYKPVGVTILRKLESGPSTVEGLTFVWTGAEDSIDLEEGSFDLKYYQEHIKKQKFGFMLARLALKAEEKEKERLEKAEKERLIKRVFEHHQDITPSIE